MVLEISYLVFLLPVQAACRHLLGQVDLGARRPGGHSPGCLPTGGQWAEFLQGQWQWAIVGSGAEVLSACPAEHPHPTGFVPPRRNWGSIWGKSLPSQQIGTILGTVTLVAHSVSLPLHSGAT